MKNLVILILAVAAITGFGLAYTKNEVAKKATQELRAAQRDALKTEDLIKRQQKEIARLTKRSDNLVVEVNKLLAEKTK